MQRFTGACVLLGLASSVYGLGLRTPKESEKPDIKVPKKLDIKFPDPVPVPEAPTVELPTHHLKQLQKTDIECKALDTCLAQYAGKGKDSALKTCVLKNLGQEKGEKVWEIYSKAKLPGNQKVSLAALRSSSPSSYFKVLGVLRQALGKEGALLQMDFCAAATSFYNATSVGEVFDKHEPKKDKFGVFMQNEPKKEPKVKMDAAAATGVAVPEEPDVDLPMPGKAHPEHSKDGNANETPASCSKLDTCLSKVDADKYEAGFEKCVSDFCKESYKANDFKGKDDPRTELCDKKGKESWDMIAKAGAAVKKSATLLGLPKQSLISSTRSMISDSDVYSRIMQVVFPKGTTLVAMQQTCHL